MVYLVTEMGSTVHAFRWDDNRGVLTEVQSISTLPPDFAGISAAAEVKISPDGRCLYASNRGLNSIAVFSINQKNGRLTRVQEEPSGGEIPRNMEFEPTGHWLLVTNHNSNNAVVFRIDQTTGRLMPVGTPVEVPYPFCPRFLKPE